MKFHIILLPGDGIGPEVVAAAVRGLNWVAQKHGHSFEFTEHLIGGCAIDRFGVAVTDETLAACKSADAVLLGAVGGPKWDDPAAKVRPEQGLLALRKGLGGFANLRPVRVHPALVDASPLKPEKLFGVDILVVRELTGGLYFGKPKGREKLNGHERAVDTLVYHDYEIRRVVDTAAMRLITSPLSFDVVVTENMFGDILTDEASVLAGSMGILPSASLGENGPGLYEPIHGSAPDIAGKGIANPIGTILSAALLLRYTLKLEKEAAVIKSAVEQTVAAGCRTVDLGGVLTTKQMTEEIMSRF